MTIARTKNETFEILINLFDLILSVGQISFNLLITAMPPACVFLFHA